ncbi:hypothetical protein TRICI_005884 [Trichomonascus ciferrii]|uniref:Uncharacterized protein n=1 Tax=Trichomonascus ciferrii TaxID=44093 RepID=A0A642UP01_9ASCO|nr:hypothetical protein TRICI_005884 [Trichomonascus ciferrii]
MNCPSRVDETLLHPDWNQNPSELAPDLTTRADLGVTANSRVVRSGQVAEELASSEYSRHLGTSLDSTTGDQNTFVHAQAEGDRESMMKQYHHAFEKDNYSSSPSASGHSIPVVPVYSDNYNNNKERRHAFSVKSPFVYLGFCLVLLLLVLSVFCDFGNFASCAKDVLVDFKTNSIFAKEIVPAHLKKRGTCSRSGTGEDEYNTPLHIGAVFIIFGVSWAACVFPVFAIKFPRLRIPSSFLFAVRHFGTGVLIATAFCHLFVEAFTLLGDPCLSDFWTTDYTAMPGAIALGAVFMVALIEMIFNPAQHACTGNVAQFSSSRERSNEQQTQEEPTTQTFQSSNTERASCENYFTGPLNGRQSSVSRRLAQMGEESERLDTIEQEELEMRQNNTAKKEQEETKEIDEDPERRDPSEKLTPEQQKRKDLMQCVLLECGILFHSVFIGMALSVSIGNEFAILLIAISFHRKFLLC